MNVYIITSAKFEECYIEEWVQYHLNIGFDKIIINDNNPKDYPYNPKDILKKYIDNGQVIVERYLIDDYHRNNDEINCTEEDLLTCTYTWLYEKYKDEFDWVAKLDIDEFFEIPETNNDIKKFLSQSKFDNALSICFPLIPFIVKDEYYLYYTRLKNNRDRFIKFDMNMYYFKTIIKNTEYVNYLTTHFAYFSENNFVSYMLPNGEDAQVKLFLASDVPEDIFIKRQEQYKQYVYNTFSNICFADHYTYRSIEENCIKTIKFEGNTHTNSCLHNWYLELKNQHPEMFDNMRDLYKLYFIDNINNIKD